MSFRRVLITGTTSGMGQAFQEELLAQGKTVIAVNRRKSGAAHEAVIDITNYEEVFAFLARLQLQDQTPDLFILNAGINKADNQGAIDISTFGEVWKINYTGVLNFISAARALGITGVTFGCLSSTSNIVPNPGHLAYFLSKQALKDTFQILQKTDSANYYRTVVLSPVATGIMGNCAKPLGIQGWIYDRLVVSKETAARTCLRFFESKRPIFYYTRRACLFYFAVRVLLRVVPGLYKGNIKAPSDASGALRPFSHSAPTA